MNRRLAESASPYLRAHADNPVDWYAWGPEAFAEAARREVPVLVSIGYATCHWCHVMARESFQDAATAAVINEGFVAIKVDREEHPDVDAAYLAAASAFTPHLGWPLTVFTTPGGQVFYAGTYWPREARAPLPAFREVLAAVREAWTERREEVERTGASLREALTAAAASSVAHSGLPGMDELAEAARRLVQSEDRQYAGFAGGAGMAAPKFPMVPALRFLQAPALAASVPEAAPVAARALAAMVAGELHDPVDGGFFRYATRRDWRVPHFERMLTDNAGLIEVALDASDPATATHAARFLIGVLQQDGGGFAAAQDSESIIDGERNEGGYYALDAAGRVGLTPPALDGKIVTGWNGLAIAALARAGAHLDDPRMLAAAGRAADAVLETNIVDGVLRRASLGELVSRAPATLEDYGALATGLLRLAAATGESRYAVSARALIDACVDEGTVVVPGGGDPVLSGHGMALGGSDTDGASPSPTASFAGAALTLWLFGAGEQYREVAASLVGRVASSALEQPLAHGSILEIATSLVSSPRQVVVVGEAGSALAASARRIRADVVAFVTAEQSADFAEAGFSLFEGKAARGGVATAYDCQSFVCRLPVTDPADLVP